MKLSNKELIILAFFLAIAIMAAGAFLYVLPEYEKAEANRNTLQATKDEKNQIYASLEREATIDQEIQDAINRANAFTAYFYDDMTTYEADVIVREILAATNMSTRSLSLGSFTTATLTVADYVETAVSYPLKEYSGYDPGQLSSTNYYLEYDEEGKLIVPEDYIEKYGDQALTEFLTAKLSTQTQTVGAVTATFTIEGTRGDFLNFLNYVASLERSTVINSTSVVYTRAVTNANTNNNNNNNAAAEGEEENAEAEEAEPVALAAENTLGGEQQLTDDAQISAAISLTMYCVTPMQEEVFADAETETAE